MSFNGPALSFDDEGSILFDGENIIVNVPVGHELLEHIGTEESIPFPVVYTHPSHHQNQQPSPDTPSLHDNPVFIKEQAQEFNENVRKARESARKGQSAGQAPSSDSGGQGSTGSSQTEIPPISSDANDEPSAQAVLLDIDELKDDVGSDHGLADSISPEGLYACGNVDILLVKQDMETRPLTFSCCFEQFPSPRIACDFLYAEVPKCSDSELATLQQQVSMGGGTDDENGQDSIGSGSDMYHSVYVDEEYLNSEYGITVVWHDSYTKTQASSQLNNLAKAVDLIVNYLAMGVFGGDRDKARSTFLQYFGNLEVHLGADAILAENLRIPEEDAVTYGIVPLSGLTDQNKMFLGSKVYISTIAHEFGHVIDISTQVSWKYDENDDGFQSAWIDETKISMNELILEQVIEGFAAKQIPTAEIWADIFMTAVLDQSVSGKTYRVFSVKEEYIDDLRAGTFFDCECNNNECKKCEYRNVGWQKTNRARDVNAYLSMLFEELLIPQPGGGKDE